jgi:Rieske Fe-S protein
MARRRTFLQLAGAVSLGVVPACGGSKNGGISGDVAAGNVKDLPVGTLRAVGGEPVAIGRDTKGVYALTTICTHAGCDMSTEGSIAATGLSCGCHGSRFDANGGVTRGPAQSGLEHYQVDVGADGTMTIHGGSVVDAATRTAVPSGLG